MADDTTTSDATAADTTPGSLADLVARGVVSRAGGGARGQFGSQFVGQFGQSVWTCLEPADATASLPRAIFPSGFRGIDRLLPAGGIGSGSLIEWIGGPASGAATLAFAVAGRLRAARPEGTAGPILVVDRQERFHPPAVMPWLEGPPAGKPKASGAAVEGPFRQTIVCRDGHSGQVVGVERNDIVPGRLLQALTDAADDPQIHLKANKSHARIGGDFRDDAIQFDGDWSVGENHPLEPGVGLAQDRVGGFTKQRGGRSLVEAG